MSRSRLASLPSGRRSSLFARRCWFSSGITHSEALAASCEPGWPQLLPRSSSKPDACSSCREVLRNLQNEGQNDIRHPKNENCSSRLEPLVVRKQFLPEAHDASDWAHLGTGLHVVVPLPSPCLALAPKTAKSLSFRLREDFESDHRSAWSALRRFLAPNIRRTRRRQASACHVIRHAPFGPSTSCRAS